MTFVRLENGLLREDEIISAAKIYREILLKLDRNNGYSCCIFCIFFCDEEYQFDIEETIFC